MTARTLPGKRVFGVIGGLGALAGADVLFKLIQASKARSGAEHFDIVFEQHPLRNASASRAATTERKLYIFDMIRDFERRGVTTVLLPCFLSHTFIGELQENVSVQIVDMVEALREHVARCFPSVRRIGVLTSNYIRNEHLFERYFSAPEFEVLHPRGSVLGDVDPVATAVYGDGDIKSGELNGRPVEQLREACLDLIAQGAELILPGIAEIGLVADQIGPLCVPIVDSNLVYAQYAVAGQSDTRYRMFKVGVVGGVGPAATVDFMQKLVLSTPATRDQEHIKLLVEQNPQIPDRTENLLGDGPDPTVSLYATCKKLEAGDVDIIAIPCNTAHAFVERIQPYLNVPIVNMLTVSVEYLRAAFPELREVGLLATTGTIMSGVYRKALEARGLRQVVPSDALQTRVMNAIYGERGVKAGFSAGECIDDVTAAVDELSERGVEVILLGCTELPLLLPRREVRSGSGGVVRLVDPTDILAKRCVAYALGEVGVGAGLRRPEERGVAHR
ncbi:amino acid racemase [Paraburkholderia phenazinium]|uniref:Aspartate racemase n=1 Tax=Paraburkholderia phenazinium TaxID=60549 RepID=A0A1G8IH00_9BURK|nr:amino acid racemase [Paraburkholderia phenazinium]SDI18289.1 aspartate racemase [Paraburkholderia phenazinium]